MVILISSFILAFEFVHGNLLGRFGCFKPTQQPFFVQINLSHTRQGPRYFFFGLAEPFIECLEMDILVLCIFRHGMLTSSCLSLCTRMGVFSPMKNLALKILAWRSYCRSSILSLQRGCRQLKYSGFNLQTVNIFPCICARCSFSGFDSDGLAASETQLLLVFQNFEASSFVSQIVNFTIPTGGILKIYYLGW